MENRSTFLKNPQVNVLFVRLTFVPLSESLFVCLCVCSSVCMFGLLFVCLVVCLCV